MFDESVEQAVLNAVRAAGQPVSARNLARKIGVRRGIITRILHYHDGSFKLTITRPYNVRHKKPVWTVKEN